MAVFPPMLTKCFYFPSLFACPFLSLNPSCLLLLFLALVTISVSLSWLSLCHLLTVCCCLSGLFLCAHLFLFLFPLLLSLSLYLHLRRFSLSFSSSCSLLLSSFLTPLATAGLNRRVSCAKGTGQDRPVLPWQQPAGRARVHDVSL